MGDWKENELAGMETGGGRTRPEHAKRRFVGDWPWRTQEDRGRKEQRLAPTAIIGPHMSRRVSRRGREEVQ